MKILFSIPIYAFSEDVLYQQYEKQLQKFLQNSKANFETEQSKINRFQEMHRNHLIYKNYIIGFLDIQYDKGDITFHKYLMVTRKNICSLKERNELIDKLNNKNLSISEKDMIWAQYNTKKDILYRMHYGSEKKHYMKYENISGFHICGLTSKSNAEILEEIEHDLNAIIKDIQLSYGKSIYFDLNNYNSIKRYVDFGLIVNDD